MKKLFTLILGITLAYSCSTSSDENGNSNTTVVPVAPSNLTGTLVSATQINLSWTDNSTNETGFKIERKTGTGVYAVVGTTATDVTTFSNTGLTPSTTYTYRVYSYNAGGNSPTYSNELNLNTSTSVTDIDGNVYQTVTICNQTWTKTNLNVSKYRNGDVIPQVTDPTAWANLTTGAWCYYNNDQVNGPIYGKLYNWYAVNDPRGLAPAGWHIPTDGEWKNLIDCVDPTNQSSTIGQNNAGAILKSTGTIEGGTGLWYSPNSGATNEVDFSALPAGFRNNNSSYGYKGYTSGFWSSSVYSQGLGRNCLFYHDQLSALRAGTYMKDGFSIRCVKD